jgi:hypothetical protein
MPKTKPDDSARKTNHKQSVRSTYLIYVSILFASRLVVLAVATYHDAQQALASVNVLLMAIASEQGRDGMLQVEITYIDPNQISNKPMYYHPQYALFKFPQALGLLSFAILYLIHSRGPVENAKRLTITIHAQ